MIKPFPPVKPMDDSDEEKDNPAVLLFGRRFFSDQTVPELLVELLLVASASKKIGNTLLPQDQIFPERQLLQNWPTAKGLQYAAKARLNLKLFAFLSASKLESRHESHRQHYRNLLLDIKKPDHLDAGTIDKDEVLRTLENLFRGFQGVGGDRTWCAQAFIPISEALLAAETLWNDTQARRDDPHDWDTVLTRYNYYFSMNRHRFLARGGELLYLQICNALSQNNLDIQAWCKEVGIIYTSAEYEPVFLREQLQIKINAVLNSCPETIDKLAAFIDLGVDASTADITDQGKDGDRFAECAWCPAEGWPEGLLFAVEFLRICSADIDAIKRIELMETACALQVLRTLCAQSARYSELSKNAADYTGPFRFVWVLSDPEGRDKTVKQVSRRNIKTVQKLLFEAIRHPEIMTAIAKSKRSDVLYKQADTHYGHKLFITLAKRIGLIIPRRGTGARFVLNETLLRFLVMALIRPGKRVTYETFKNLLFTHYGMAVDSNRISKACQWGGMAQISSLGSNTDGWLLKMLNEAGVLVRLSDSHSLVINPFSAGDGSS